MALSTVWEEVSRALMFFWNAKIRAWDTPFPCCYSLILLLRSIQYHLSAKEQGPEGQELLGYSWLCSGCYTFPAISHLPVFFPLICLASSEEKASGMCEFEMVKCSLPLLSHRWTCDEPAAFNLHHGVNILSDACCYSTIVTSRKKERNYT